MTVKDQPVVPLEAEIIAPEVFVRLTNAEIRALPVFLGKNERRLDDYFDVDGEKSDHIRIVGDARQVKWIGRDMSHGRIEIDGNAGMHLGSKMSGGEIEVSGNVTDWLGAEMSGGTIRVRGNAGGQVGGAYRGDLAGMRDGTIVIEGTAGIEVGGRMKRGTIVVVGGVRDFAGLEMRGGTLVLGGAELRTGAWMMRGTIISLKPIPVLPTFAYATTYSPSFLGVYARHLKTLGIDIPVDESAGSYRRYTGDAAIPGRGELLIWEPRGA